MYCKTLLLVNLLTNNENVLLLFIEHKYVDMLSETRKSIAKNKRIDNVLCTEKKKHGEEKEY